MSGVADTVQPVVARIDRRAPGVRDCALRFWDGSEVPPPPGARGGLTLVVRSPDAFAYALRQPNELGLGRAWVSGALDVEGDLERGLALRDRFRGLKLSLADRLVALRAAACAGE
jgi:cyclopropane-fatty-acyl-phospholipid synthase